MTETTPQPDPQPQPEDATQEWRPFSYADGATGTTEATGAQLRTGPATTPEHGTVLAGGGQEATGGAGAEGEVQLPAVLVPDTPETREAEQHPNLAAPPVAGGESLGTAEGTGGAEAEPADGAEAAGESTGPAEDA